jgi:hypothetical protein
MQKKILKHFNPQHTPQAWNSTTTWNSCGFLWNHAWKYTTIWICSCKKVQTFVAHTNFPQQAVCRIMIYEMQKMHISLHERKTKTPGTWTSYTKASQKSSIRAEITNPNTTLLLCFGHASPEIHHWWCPASDFKCSRHILRQLHWWRYKCTYLEQQLMKAVPGIDKHGCSPSGLRA